MAFVRTAVAARARPPPHRAPIESRIEGFAPVCARWGVRALAPGLASAKAEHAGVNRTRTQDRPMLRSIPLLQRNVDSPASFQCLWEGGPASGRQPRRPPRAWAGRHKHPPWHASPGAGTPPRPRRPGASEIRGPGSGSILTQVVRGRRVLFLDAIRRVRASASAFETSALFPGRFQRQRTTHLDLLASPSSSSSSPGSRRRGATQLPKQASPPRGAHGGANPGASRAG